MGFFLSVQFYVFPRAKWREDIKLHEGYKPINPQKSMVQLTCTMVILIGHNDIKCTNYLVIHFIAAEFVCMVDVVMLSLLEKV